MSKLMYFRLRTQLRAWRILRDCMTEDGTIIHRPVSGSGDRCQLGVDLLRYAGAIQKESRGRWFVSDREYIEQLEEWGRKNEKA